MRLQTWHCWFLRRTWDKETLTMQCPDKQRQWDKVPPMLLRSLGLLTRLVSLSWSTTEIERALRGQEEPKLQWNLPMLLCCRFDMHCHPCWRCRLAWLLHLHSILCWRYNRILWRKTTNSNKKKSVLAFLMSWKEASNSPNREFLGLLEDVKWIRLDQRLLQPFLLQMLLLVVELDLSSLTMVIYYEYTTDEAWRVLDNSTWKTQEWADDSCCCDCRWLLITRRSPEWLQLLFVAQLIEEGINHDVCTFGKIRDIGERLRTNIQIDIHDGNDAKGHRG